MEKFNLNNENIYMAVCKCRYAFNECLIEYKFIWLRTDDNQKLNL